MMPVERGLENSTIADFLTVPLLGGHENVTADFFEIASGDESGKFFVFLEFHQAGNGFAARGGGGFRQFINFQPVDAAFGSENQNITVRGSDEEMLDEIFFLGARADAAFAAAGLVAIGVGGSALDVAGMADGDEHVGVGDEIFELDLVDLVDDLRAAIVAVGFVDFAELGGDDLLELFLAGKNFFQLGDEFADGFQFLENFVDGELRQAMELQFEDGVDLDGSEAESGAAGGVAFDGAELVFAAIELDAGEFAGLAVFGDGDVLLGEKFEQVFAGVGAIAGTANDADDVVEMVESDLVADQNVFALAGFAKLEDGAAADDFDAMLDEQLDQRDQPELAGLAGHDGQQNHAERFLHLRELE